MRDLYVEARIAFSDRPDVRLWTREQPDGAQLLALEQPPTRDVLGGLGGIYAPYMIRGALLARSLGADEDVTDAARALRERYDRHLHEIVPHDPFRGAERFLERWPRGEPAPRHLRLVL